MTKIRAKCVPKYLLDEGGQKIFESLMQENLRLVTHFYGVLEN